MIKKLYNKWRWFIIRLGRDYKSAIESEERNFERIQREISEKEMKDYIKINPKVLEVYIPCGLLSTFGNVPRGWDWKDIKNNSLQYSGAKYENRSQN